MEELAGTSGTAARWPDRCWGGGLMKRWPWLLCPLIAPLVWAQTASFDCGRTVLPREKAVCASASLAGVDREMTAAYRRALRPLSPKAADLMRGDQHGWLRWIDTVCRASATPDLAKLADCMVGPYQERTEDLAAAVFSRSEGVFFTRAVYLAKSEVVEQDLGGFQFPGFGILAARWLQADTAAPAWTAWNEAMERAAFRVAGEKNRWTNEPAGDRMRIYACS